MTQFTATKRKTERLCKSHAVIKNNINEKSMQFTEKFPACHPGYVLVGVAQ
jgi:hypothetical protein